MKNLTEKQILNIIEERLNLQSTRRNLEIYGVKNYNLNYFQSSEFGRLFKEWDQQKQEKFLKNLAGNYWTKLGNYVGKN